jgi:hypothetical protein
MAASLRPGFYPIDESPNVEFVVNGWTRTIGRGICLSTKGRWTMTTTWSGHLVGTFLGYSRGLTYELSDGSKWVQDDPTHEPVYRENPMAHLLSNGMGHTYLDVEGTSAVVLVVRLGSKTRPHAGAF